MEIPGLALYETALKFRAQRNEVLSANIANADTPGYQARDLDFRQVLTDAGSKTVRMTTSNVGHLGAGGHNAMSTADALMYRVPMQPTLDGNTVETDVEQAAFAENAIQYRASLAFLDGSIRTLKPFGKHPFGCCFYP